MRIFPSLLTSTLSASTKRANYIFPHATSFLSKPKYLPEDCKGYLNELEEDSEISMWFKELRKRHGGIAFPGTKKEKLRSAGEDAFFVQEMKDGTGLALGVADGVGGFSDSGIDASSFSQALSYYTSNIISNFRLYPPSDSIHQTQTSSLSSSSSGSSSPPGSPGSGSRTYSTWTSEEGEGECLKSVKVLGAEGERFVLGDALQEVWKDNRVLAGGSTSCIVTLNSKTGDLRSLNLGDSGFVVIRSSQILYSAPPLIFKFNGPLQLTKSPSFADKTRVLRSDRISLLSKKQKKNFLMMGGGSIQREHQVLKVAEHKTLKLKAGDVLVLFTDGYSDNVWDEETAMIVGHMLRQRGETDDWTLMRNLANELVWYATNVAHTTDKYTPFEHEARRFNIFDLKGGKVDDITVQCALVVEK